MLILIEAKGYDGQLQLLEDRVVIKRKGIGGTGFAESKREKEIPIGRISSIEFQNASFLDNGYIHFSIAGSPEPGIPIWRSENTVIFSQKQQRVFEGVKAAVEKRMKSVPRTPATPVQSDLGAATPSDAKASTPPKPDPRPKLPPEPRLGSTPEVNVQADEVIMQATGNNGRLELLKDRIRIGRGGFTGFGAQGSQADREIPVKEISSLQFKEAGAVMEGYVRVAVQGEQEANQGWFYMWSDENTIIFYHDQQPAFEAIKEAIEKRMAGAQLEAAPLPHSAEREEPAEMSDMTSREKLHRIIDDLPEAEAEELLRLLSAARRLPHMRASDGSRE